MLEAIPGVDHVGTAGTLAQALHSVAHAVPELLILDLNLPDGNAVRMLPLLRRMAPQMHIAVLTNETGTISSERCLQAGADDFFDKSREFDKVLDLVRERVKLH